MLLVQDLHSELFTLNIVIRSKSTVKVNLSKKNSRPENMHDVCRGQLI